MNSIITVTEHNHRECELDVSRVVALVPRRKELLFESTYWKLNDADFDRVSELWHKLKGGEHSECFTEAQKAAEFIFQELKESEDEKTKRILHSISSKMSFHLHDIFTEEEFQCFDAWSNAWLEKQGEKKSIDDLTQQEVMDIAVAKCFNEQKPAKIERKFHKGDWIIYHGTENIYQVVAVIDNQYQLKYGDTYTIQKCADVDRCARLYDVAKDAKDGDFLVCGGDKSPFIFKGFDRFHPNCPVAYCGICEDSTVGICTDDGWWTDEEVFPATKEQRDQLEKAIADAGYIWDADNKELKKIESNLAWSEEDEKFVHGLIRGLAAKRNILGHTTFSPDCIDITETINWLKSLKDRVQPKQEKEEILGKLEEWLDEYISNLADVGTDTLIGSFRKYLDGKLPIKPKSQWKPSEGQLECLGYAIEKAKKDFSPLTNDRIYLTLKALKEQLLELRGSKV